MKKLKELWARFKVQISFIGGALVVMTTHGSCTFEPAAPEAEEVAAEVTANDIADVAVEIDLTIEEINADATTDAE
tara:strand:+ start:391 stop:618 length:228 start_codon:yes stop_codon:yes gene_type:complete